MIPAGAWRPRGRQPSPRSGPSACISFTPSNARGRLPVVAACRGIRGSCPWLLLRHREDPTPDRHVNPCVTNCRCALTGVFGSCQSRPHLSPGPLAGASRRGLSPGPLAGASRRGLSPPLAGASRRGLSPGPLAGASRRGSGPLAGASRRGLSPGPLGASGASRRGLSPGPLAGASRRGLSPGPLAGASRRGLSPGPLDEAKGGPS